jgi:hypothetical protein
LWRAKGSFCPRCAQPSQIREHVAIAAKELGKSFYFTRWFYCLNPDCQTKRFYVPGYQVRNQPEAGLSSDVMEQKFDSV